MRYTIRLALLSGCLILMAGCGGSEQVAQNEDPHQTPPPTGAPTGAPQFNAPQGGDPGGSSDPNGGGGYPGADQGLAGAGTGPPNSYPGADQGLAGAGTGGPPGSYPGGNGGYPGADASSGYPGANEGLAGAGAGPPGSGGQPGFDPSGAPPGYGPGGPGGAGSGPGTSPPNDGAPPPPGGGGGAGGNSGASPPDTGAPPPPGSGGGFSGGGFSGNGPPQGFDPNGQSGFGPDGYPGADGGFPGAGGFPGGGNNAQNDEPKTLLEQAEQAIAEGKEDDAFQYLYAYYLTDDEGRQEQELFVLPATGAPASVIWIGVGITYIAPNTYTKQPPRIGDRPNIVTRNRDNRGFGGGAPDGPPGASGGGPPQAGGGFPGAGGGDSGGEAELTYYTGEYGEKLLNRLRQRRTFEGGFYGSFLASIDENQRRGGGGGFGGGPPGGGYPGGAAGGASLGDGSNFQPPGFGNNDNNDGDDEESSLSQLIPGVVYLGKGQPRELVDTARAHSLDALLHFEVKVTVARTGTEKTEAELNLIDVKTGRTLFSQRRPLSNISVWNDRESATGNDDDPIELALDEVITENADTQFQLEQPVRMTGEQVQARVAELTSSDHENPLPVLAEIGYYHVHGMLDDEAAAAAFVALIGEDGTALATGDAEERLAAIDKWMPGNWEAQEEEQEFR